MQSSDRILAQRYGRALFLVAEAKGHGASAFAEFAAAQRKLLDLEPVLKNPRIGAPEKKSKVDEALGVKSSPLIRRFLGLLIDKKRCGIIPLITAVLNRLAAEKKNTARAYVRSARPMSEQARERLAQSLKRFSGKNVEVDVHVDPRLIGGAVVRLGDWVLDGSFRSQLKRLGDQLANH